MQKQRILSIGLDEPEYLDLKPRLEDCYIVFHPVLPVYRIEQGVLWVESHTAGGRFLPVDQVIFHGIFGDDFDFITALALWRGPCLPNATGLLDCRLRLPCLAKSLAVTRFGTMRRSFASKETTIQAKGDTVAKWGNWHCGENKVRFTDFFTTEEATVFEPFIQGKAVRVVLMGERFWQIQLEGEGWLKSIHHEKASFMEVDPELLEDTRALSKELHLEMLGVDYMVGDDGQKHLLEVNHIPNVTRFPELREAFLEFAAGWVQSNLKTNVT